MKLKRTLHNYSDAYLLPATIILGLATSIVVGAVLQVTSFTSTTLNNQSFDSIAADAARSGIAYADKCLQEGPATWTTANTLRPETNCSGIGSTGSSYVTVQGTEWRSKFRVTPPDAQGIIVSTGIVEITNRGGQTVSSTTKELRMSTTTGSVYDKFDTATGQSVTSVDADTSDCAIANGSLYCWGANVAGQVGNGNSSVQSNPVRVTSDPSVTDKFEDKTITKVSISDASICAIADGKPYCWGDNGYNQLGNGSVFTDYTRPTANIPRTDDGPLENAIVTDIGTAASNNPAAFTPFSPTLMTWPFATAFQHSCALTANGSVSCWGYGGFRQLTGGGCFFNITIWPPFFGWRCSYPSESRPTLIKGYRDNDNIFAGKKSVRIGTSSHDSCLVADGILYCIGVQAPLNPEGFSETSDGMDFFTQFANNLAGVGRNMCTWPLGMFSDADLTWWVINPCVMSYSNGYNAINSPSSEASGTILDPATLDISSNEGCWMASKKFYCFGITPAFGPFYLKAYRAPVDFTSKVDSTGRIDVTDADNGDYNDKTPILGGLSGLYCVVDKGIGKCAGQPLNLDRGDGGQSFAYEAFVPLAVDAGLNDSRVSVQTATSIAAGVDHGCVVANGKLFCWGNNGALAGSNNGNLANNTTWGGLTKPTRTGLDGAIKLGIDLPPMDPAKPGELAAHDSVSTGDNHTCGIANGHVFCWGDNSKGQLGMGNTSAALRQPRAVPTLFTKTATKVAAGKDHTCAIIEGDLYCWGDNTKGKLGTGTSLTTPISVPQRINGNGGEITSTMRVTDISVSDNNTCAVADAKVYCWGDNVSAQLGDGSTNDRSRPTLVDGGNSSNPINGKAATAVSVGASHACAVANADLYCWGNNANGRTGIATAQPTSQPTHITQGTAGSPRGPNNVYPSVSGVAAGSDFTCAIFNGTTSCWGSHVNGRTAQDATVTGSTSIPTAIKGNAANYYTTSISAGKDHVCAIMNGGDSKKNGNLYCWGNNANNKLGRTGSASRVDNPTKGGEMVESINGTPALRTATAVSAGKDTSCTIANAVILCWGANNSYQFGDGTTAPGSTPTKTIQYETLPRSTYSLGPVY